MIEDINKAWEMANAEKKYRETSYDRFDSFAFPVTGEDKVAFEKKADQIAEHAGEEYDKNLEKNKNKKVHFERERESNTEPLNVDNLIDKIDRILSNLRKRDDLGLQLLMERDNITRLKMSAVSLLDATREKRVNEIISNLDILVRCLDGIGKVPRQGPVKEDPESLKALARELKEIEDIANFLVNNQHEQDINNKLKKLAMIAQCQTNVMAAKIKALDAYLRSSF